MPVIQFPGYTKDPFGGPAGGTQQMFAAMLSSYMKTQEELKKREQEKLLAELLAGGGRPDQPPGADPTGPALNMPMPQGGYDTEGPQDYTSRAQAIMSNPSLDMRQKIQGMGLLTAQKELEPVAAKTKYVTVNWWDKDGKAGKPYVVPEDSANQLYERLDAMGATWEAAPKESADPELVKYQKIAASMPDGPQKRQIEAYIAKMIRIPPGEGEGKTPEDLKQKGYEQIGDKWYSPEQLRGIYRTEYNVITRDDPEWLSLTPAQRAEMNERIRKVPKYSEFVIQSRKDGFVPGSGPLPPPVTSMGDETDKRERMTPPPPAVTPDYKSMPQEQALEAALKAVGWPGNRRPTAAEKAKAAAELQKVGIR